MDFLNAIILLLNFTVLPALTYGSQLALGAIFVTLIYGVLRFANFATGDMMSFGTMFAVILTYYFQSIGINFGILPTALLTIPFAVFMMIFYMLTIDKFVFSYYRIKKSPPVQLAMVSVGVMFVTQAIIRIIIGPSDRRFLDGEKFILKATEFKEITGLNEGLTIKSTQIITILVTILVIASESNVGGQLFSYSGDIFIEEIIVAMNTNLGIEEVLPTITYESDCDINNDNNVNVVDVVLLVNMIFDDTEFGSDINQDGAVNVVDIVLLVSIVLGN